MKKRCKQCKNFLEKKSCQSKKTFGLAKYCNQRCKGDYQRDNGIAPPSRKGKTPWNKGKGCHYLRGELNNFWKGGVSRKNKTERQLAMQTVEYKLWRRSVFERDNYTCVFCDARDVRLNADHIKPWSLYPDLRYAIDNGRTLCVTCHRKTDTYNLNQHNIEEIIDKLKGGE